MPGWRQNAPTTHHRLVSPLATTLWVGRHAVRSAIHIDETNFGHRIGIALYAVCQPRVDYQYVPRFELRNQCNRLELVCTLQASHLYTWWVEAWSSLVMLSWSNWTFLTVWCSVRAGSELGATTPSRNW